MINLTFDKSSENLKKGADIILARFKVDESIDVSVKRCDRLHIENKEVGGIIEYITDASFFRMLTLFIKELKKKKSFVYEEKLNFDACGPMLDMSRNAVLKVEKVKEYIEYIAMMGLNRLVLYIEDVYELENYPYFGYMRGRYTKDELREIDEYGQLFGVEVFPAIQTLGHMERYLHWDESIPVRDTKYCLLSGEDKTYELIEDMIKTLSGCFSSKTIHVGMDEAFDFGLGTYLNKHGYTDRTEIIVSHLEKVSAIAEKYGMNVHLWSDMFFRLASKNHDYDAEGFEVSGNIKALIPKRATLVYWCYNTEDENAYTNMFKAHYKISDNLSFAGSAFNYFGYMCDTINTMRITQIALNSCKKNDIRDIYATIWEDNGAECDLFLAMLSIQLYAENMYNDTDIDAKIKENFEFMTGASYDAFIDMSQFHNIFDGREYKYWWTRYIGKRLLYQDILSGLCDEYLSAQPMAEHYKKYAKRMESYIDKNSTWNEYYEYAKVLFDVLSVKCEIAENLKNAYLSKDFEYIKDVANNKLSELYEGIKTIREYALNIWYKNNKAFGGEVIDTRLSGLLGRIETSKSRLLAYACGKIDKIEELEEKRLPFASYNASQHSAIISAGIV